MLDSTRYFQLLPDILVEYNYNNLASGTVQTGDSSGHITDLGPQDEKGCIIYNGYNYTRTLLWEEMVDSFVLPINKSESKFIQCSSGTGKIWEWNKSGFTSDAFTTSSGNYDMYDDILFDSFKLRFTSRNYLGNNNYDGYIINVNIYDKYKNKVYLLSSYVRKTDDPNIEDTPVVINQKMYTTYLDFKIPNVSAILNPEKLANSLPGETLLRQKLFPRKGYDIMDNTPLVMSVYGVKATYENNGHEYYNVEKLNSIYIPIVDNSDKLALEIHEVEDYFEIYPVVDGGKVSFSDYIAKISGDRGDAYIVFYDLMVTEYFDSQYSTEAISDVTHREQFIINAAQRMTDSGDTYLEFNEDELENILYFRPVLRHGESIDKFVIDVKINIINTLDNTTIVKRCAWGSAEHQECNPKKYGKKMSKIYLGEIPSLVNVYNKKPDLDMDGVKITNASSNVHIENHQHSVIGFIECANVGVSIEQVPAEVLKEN